MIKVESFALGELAANSHLLYDSESKKCLIIDLGGHFCEIEGAIEERGLKPCALMLTHGHFDHSFGAKSCAERGIPVYVSEKDAYMLGSEKESLAAHFGCPFEPCKAFTAISGGALEIGGFAIRVIETPGHSEGSVCYIIEDKIFSGDTLFRESFGRSDLKGGNFQKLLGSLILLLSLDDDMTVYTGHGENTTIMHEKRFNPILTYVH